jgi:hypothetical protein
VREREDALSRRCASRVPAFLATWVYPGTDMARQTAPVGFTWEDYIDGLVSQTGSLTALAGRLAVACVGGSDHAALRSSARMAFRTSA